jgi:hypothetical protein
VERLVHNEQTVKRLFPLMDNQLCGINLFASRLKISVLQFEQTIRSFALRSAAFPSSQMSIVLQYFTTNKLI